MRFWIGLGLLTLIGQTKVENVRSILENDSLL
jgi:hypothetical protein